jgi:hypothetical protein
MDDVVSPIKMSGGDQKLAELRRHSALIYCDQATARDSPRGDARTGLMESCRALPRKCLFIHHSSRGDRQTLRGTAE